MALFTAPRGCTWHGFTIARGRTAAWFVRFDNATHSGRPASGPSVGETGLILLAADSSRFFADDKWIPAWALGYCGHRQFYADDSLAFKPWDHPCTLPPSGDDGDSSEPSPGAPPPLFFTSPPGLWVACGGDCCWGSLF
jgi:hypothetical protein